jgi:hypothetical protein
MQEVEQQPSEATAASGRVDRETETRYIKPLVPTAQHAVCDEPIWCSYNVVKVFPDVGTPSFGFRLCEGMRME